MVSQMELQTEDYPVHCLIFSSLPTLQALHTPRTRPPPAFHPCPQERRALKAFWADPKEQAKVLLSPSTRALVTWGWDSFAHPGPPVLWDRLGHSQSSPRATSPVLLLPHRQRFWDQHGSLHQPPPAPMFSLWAALGFLLCSCALHNWRGFSGKSEISKS